MKSLRVARIELSGWLNNKRIIVALMLPFIIKYLAIDPLIAKNIELTSRMNIFEPFIAVGNSGLLCFLIPAVFFILISDFPVMGQNIYFYIGRSGKRNWLWGQVIFLLVSILAYLFLIFASVVIFSSGKVEMGSSWSDITTKYISLNPDMEFSYAVSLLPPNLYNQMSVKTALLRTISLQYLHFVFLSMILLLFSVWGKKRMGFVIIIFITLMGIVSCVADTRAMWLFPFANSVVWLHFTEIYRETVCSVAYSYAYYLAGIIMMAVISRSLVVRTNFCSPEE